MTTTIPLDLIDALAESPAFAAPLPSLPPLSDTASALLSSLPLTTDNLADLAERGRGAAVCSAFLFPGSNSAAPQSESQNGLDNNVNDENTLASEIEALARGFTARYRADLAPLTKAARAAHVPDKAMARAAQDALPRLRALREHMAMVRRIKGTVWSAKMELERTRSILEVEPTPRRRRQKRKHHSSHEQKREY
ncbi:hypothetical protein BC828DRAFT_385278, partial [Blastocladiella britannica]